MATAVTGLAPQSVVIVARETDAITRVSETEKLQMRVSGRAAVLVGYARTL